MLVLIVGCFGLLSNVLGLFLFHEHGHSHGGHSHSESEGTVAAEEGHSHAHKHGMDGHTEAVADEGGNVADVLPQSTIGNWPKSVGGTSNAAHPKRRFTRSDEDDNTATNSTSPISSRRRLSNPGGVARHQRHASGSRSRLSVDDIHVHPASFRQDIIRQSKMEYIESGSSSEADNEEAVVEDGQPATETSPLLIHSKTNGPSKGGHSHGKHYEHDSLHASHNHRQPKEATKDGHSHGDLNMRGVFLHVMGDALGNIGVIVSALIIWLTKYPWRFYMDPAISLVITLIILGSAIPLCKAASRILLQAVPAGISIDEIKEDIETLPGILSCHHLHVWQLSDTKLVASLHVQIEFDFKGEGSARYMQLARSVRKCLHEYGIHSSTIQPEFCLDSEHRHTSDDEGHNGTGRNTISKSSSRAASTRSEADACLLECGDDCDDGKQCCAPAIAGEEQSHDGHGH